MLETLTEELNLPVKSFGATTLNRADLEHGAEPDSCYYIQHVHQIEGRHVDLATDPPPDLIIEIDISSPSSRRIDIYKQLGVPEVWRYLRWERAHLSAAKRGVRPLRAEPGFCSCVHGSNQSILAPG